MPEFPTLAEVLAEHRWESRSTTTRYVGACSCGWQKDVTGTHKTGVQLHSEHQAAAWRAACTIETVDQLDALPADAAVVDDDKWAWQKDTNLGSKLWIPAAFRAEFLVDDGGRPSLPARLFWHPGWSA